jgi:hypothetical protein
MWLAERSIWGFLCGVRKTQLRELDIAKGEVVEFVFIGLITL